MPNSTSHSCLGIRVTRILTNVCAYARRLGPGIERSLLSWPWYATNPIIGRYGFWIDDENNKINLNTAYGK